MTCPECGRWAPADVETGYDSDDVCPECKRVEITRIHQPEEGPIVIEVRDETI